MIATPVGPRPIESINPGDRVYAFDGSAVRVLKRWDNGIREVNRLTRRGVEWACATSEHKFLRRKDATRQAEVKPLIARNQVRRVEVNAPLGSVYEPHAYALGALLGDGCCREAGRKLHLSSSSSAVPSAVASELSGDSRKNPSQNYTYTITVDPPALYDDWCRDRYAHEKIADLDTLRTWDRSSLLRFIAGLIDTDGSIYLDQCGTLVIQIGMQARSVIDAIQWAFLALWQTPLTTHEDRRERYLHGSVWYVRVASNAFSKRIVKELDPWIVTEKKKWRPEYEYLRAERSSPEWVALRSEPLGYEETYDLTIDHPSHLFLLANGLVSSNSGKTEAIGGLCFCRWLRDHATDGDVYWCIAQSAQTLRDIPQKTLWNFLPRSMFPEGFEYSPKLGFGQVPTMELTLPQNRGKVELAFKTEEQDLKAFESSRVNGVWWSEAKREAIFYALQPRLAARAGWLLLDYVPTEAWHRDRLQEPAASGANPWIYHSRFAMVDNAHNLPLGTIEYQRAQLSAEEAAVRIDGKDAAGFGVVYKQFVPDRHVVEPFELPSDCPRWRTMDYGYRNPTACLWVAAVPPGFELPDGRRLDAGGLIVYREHHVSERTVDQNAQSIIELSQNENYQGPVILDPTATAITQANGKSIAQAFREAGLVVRPGIRVNHYGALAMVENVRRLFENDQLFFFSTCKRSIYEHRVWRYKEKRDGTTAGNDPFEEQNDHSCDALKLLVAENPSYRPSLQGQVQDLAPAEQV